MVIMRHAADDFEALRICQGMDDCGIRIVSVVCDRGKRPDRLVLVPYHIIGQAEHIDYDYVDEAIDWVTTQSQRRSDAS